LDGYASQLTRETSALHGQSSKFEFDPNRIYLFRVRTALDQQGNVVSARYGKIYGDFMQFTYYYNPTPNDRNIEFNPKQNLLGGLQAFERVTAP
jgi:phage-related protein